MEIVDPDKSLSSSFEVGYDVKLKLGFDDVPDNYLLYGFISGNGIEETDNGYRLQCFDYLNQLVTENIYLTKPDEPVKNIYGNINYRKNYDGWECYNVISDLVNSLEGTPLTVGGAGTYPMKVISTANSFYGMGTKKSFIDKALALCTDTDLVTNPYPLNYHYYQTNDSTGATFQFIKEKNSDTATPEYYFDDTSFMLTGNIIYNIDQYTSAKVSDTDIYYRNEGAISTYGEKCIILDKVHESYAKNHQMAVDVVEKLRFPNRSFEIQVYGGLDIELGNYVNISSDTKPNLSGTHQVNQVSYEVSSNTVTTTLTLSNRLTKLIDTIQLK